MMTVAAKTKQAVNKHGVQVGDFFSSSWGYDQTNIDFYKVVRVTTAGVWVQKWRKGYIGDQFAPQVGVVPGSGPATYVDWSAVDYSADEWEQRQQKVEREVEPEFHRTNQVKWGGEPKACFSVASYANAYAWDGKPEQETGAGWGH